MADVCHQAPANIFFIFEYQWLMVGLTRILSGLVWVYPIGLLKAWCSVICIAGTQDIFD